MLKMLHFGQLATVIRYLVKLMTAVKMMELQMADKQLSLVEKVKLESTAKTIRGKIDNTSFTRKTALKLLRTSTHIKENFQTKFNLKFKTVITLTTVVQFLRGPVDVTAGFF
jgi:endonuclease III